MKSKRFIVPLPFSFFALLVALFFISGCVKHSERILKSPCIGFGPVKDECLHRTPANS